jgi:hypothetical protein
MRNALMCGFLLAMIACGGGGGASQPSTAARPVRGPADLITEAEISASIYQNALEIVQNLRPSMLIPRGIGSDASGMLAASIPIVIYQDDIRLGEIRSLINIPAGRIKEIRFVGARDATTRYGTGHSSGVILVTTKR